MTSRRRASGRARSRAPSSESAAVFQRVTRAESITASSAPVASSKSSSAPCTEGRPRAGLPGSTVTALTAAPRPSIQAARVEQRVGAAGQEAGRRSAAARPRWPSASASAIAQPVEPVLDVPRGDVGDRRHQAPTATIALASWSRPSAGRPAMLIRLSPTM